MDRFKIIDKHPKYEISKDGVIRQNETGKILKATPSNGHLRVKLDNKTEYVGRLVAEAYCPKMESYYTDIRYKDGNKRNVSSDNIEWTTHRVTQCESFKNVDKAPGGTMPPKCILDMSTNVKYSSLRSCAKDLQIPPVKIRRMLRKGIRFKQID